MKNKKIICGSFVLAIFLNACTAAETALENTIKKTLNNMNEMDTKTIGTSSGAAIGALAGNLIGKDTKGTLIGTAIGGLAGLGWAAYKDQQSQELSSKIQNKEIKINNNQKYITLNLPERALFSTNTHILDNGARELNEIVEVVKQYPESKIIVIGHTDNLGSYSQNMDLSTNRARSVTDYLIRQGISANRVTAYGEGSRNPIEDNNTEYGRYKNRRVEIQIVPAT